MPPVITMYVYTSICTDLVIKLPNIRSPSLEASTPSRSIPWGRTASLPFSSMPQTSEDLISRSCGRCLRLPLLSAEIASDIRRYCKGGGVAVCSCSPVCAVSSLGRPVCFLDGFENPGPLPTESVQHRYHSQCPGRSLRMSRVSGKCQGASTQRLSFSTICVHCSVRRVF